MVVCGLKRRFGVNSPRFSHLPTIMKNSPTVQYQNLGLGGGGSFIKPLLDLILTGKYYGQNSYFFPTPTSLFFLISSRFQDAIRNKNRLFLISYFKRRYQISGSFLSVLQGREKMRSLVQIVIIVQYDRKLKFKNNLEEHVQKMFQNKVLVVFQKGR